MIFWGNVDRIFLQVTRAKHKDLSAYSGDVVGVRVVKRSATKVKLKHSKVYNEQN